MKNKKAMSAVITTVILVALVLVAIGIVWMVVSGILGGSEEDANLGIKCLNIQVEPISLVCVDNPNDAEDNPVAGGKCSVKLKRSGTGTGNIDGVTIILEDETNDVSENIAQLGTYTAESVPYTGSKPSSVKAAVYFNKESGEKYLCAASSYSL